MSLDHRVFFFHKKQTHNIFKKKKNNNGVIFKATNKKWDNLQLKAGDEVKCTYERDNESKIVQITNIAHVFYKHTVHADTNSRKFVEVKTFASISTISKPVLSFFSLAYWIIHNAVKMIKQQRYGISLQNGVKPIFFRWQKKKVKLKIMYVFQLWTNLKKKKKQHTHTYTHNKEYEDWDEWKNEGTLKAMALEWLEFHKSVSNPHSHSHSHSTEKTKETEQILWYRHYIELEILKEIMLDCIKEKCSIPELLTITVAEWQTENKINAANLRGGDIDDKEDEKKDATLSRENNTFESKWPEIDALRGLIEKFHNTPVDSNTRVIEAISDDVRALEMKQKIQFYQSEGVNDIPILGTLSQYKKPKVLRIYVHVPNTGSNNAQPSNKFFCNLIQSPLEFLFLFIRLTYTYTCMVCICAYSNVPYYCCDNHLLFYLILYPLADDSASLYWSDFRVNNDTKLHVRVFGNQPMVLFKGDIPGHTSAWFLKESSFWQGMKDVITSSRNSSPSRLILEHLTNSIDDIESSRLAKERWSDMRSALNFDFEQCQQLYESKIDHFEDNKATKKTVSNKQTNKHTHIYIYSNLCFWGNSWKIKENAWPHGRYLRLLVSDFENHRSKAYVSYWNEKKMDGYQQLILVPCFNYLSWAQSQVSRYNPVHAGELFKNIEFRTQLNHLELEQQCLELLQLDIELQDAKIYRKVFVEGILFELLHVQKESSASLALSQRIVEILLDKLSPESKSQVWTQLLTMRYGKCWRVLLQLWKCDFAKWNAFLENLANSGVLEKQSVKNELLQVFQHKAFWELIVSSADTLKNFIQFVMSQKLIWHAPEDILKTMEHCIDCEQIHKEQVAIQLFDLLWNLPFDSISIRRSVCESTETMLRTLISRTSSHPLCLRLFQRKTEKKVTLDDLLARVLKKWIRGDYFDHQSSFRSYHSRILRFLSLPEFFQTPTCYQESLLEDVMHNANFITFDAKYWTETDVKTIGECLNQEWTDLSLWDQLFEIIMKIPEQLEFSRNIPNPVVEEKREENTQSEQATSSNDPLDMDIDEDVYDDNKDDVKEKETVPQVQEDTNANINSQIMCRRLSYCFKCIMWISLLNKASDKVKACKQLLLFIETTLRTLFQSVADNSITVYVCQFIAEDQSALSNIKILRTILSQLNDMDRNIVKTLEETTKNFKEFAAMIGMFKQMFGKYLSLEDVSVRLKYFNAFCENWTFKSFPKCFTAWEKERDLLSSCIKPMQVLINLRESSAFGKIWNTQKSEFKRSENDPFLDFMTRHFDSVCLKWKSLIQDVDKELLRFEDLKWFEPSGLAVEMKHLFPGITEEKRNAMVQSIGEKTRKATRLKQMKAPWKKLQTVTEKWQAYHTQKEWKKDDKWNEFVETLGKIEQLLQQEQLLTIEDVSKCYDKCISCVSDVALQSDDFFDLCLKNEKTIKIIATDENFSKLEFFENTMQTLDNSRESRFQQLVSYLRVVNVEMQNRIWKAKFENVSEFAKIIQILPRCQPEFVSKFSKCCDEDLVAIIHLVEEDGILQAEQSLNKLKKANECGEWKFATCQKILQMPSEEALEATTTTPSGADTPKETPSSNKMNKISTLAEQKDPLVLRIDGKDLNCDQVEQIIDQVLLRYSKNELQPIQHIIHQFECCKEISAYRVEFWKKGGRVEHDSLTLSVNEQTLAFTKHKKQWQDQLNDWNSTRTKMRQEFPVLNYFCFNEIRLLIQRLNDIILSRKNIWEILGSKYVLPFLQRIDFEFEDILSILNQWKKISVESEESLHRFGQILDGVWQKSNNNRIRVSSTTCILELGKPNLIVEQKEGLFSILELFKTHGMIPRSEHVLICKSTTTDEEIECLLFRAIKAAEYAIQHQSRRVPLYCLVWPEKLSRETMDHTLRLFDSLLLSDEALEKLQMAPYLFAIVSSQLYNELSQKLMPFRIPERVALSNDTAKQILPQMYCDNLTAFAQQNARPLVQLYVSNNVGIGKTYKIRSEIAAIRQLNNNVQNVCVAFNSGTLDMEFIIRRLWKYHPCHNKHDIVQGIESIEAKCKKSKYKKNNLIVYHFDLSSCISNEMNDFLFELLLLQHVDTSLSISDCFHVNKNMAFLIEIPSKLNNSKDFPKDLLHVLFGKIAFPTIQVDGQSNPFQFEFDAGRLQTQDPNPIDIPNLTIAEMEQFMSTKFSHIHSMTPLHRITFFKYLFQQFECLAESPFLRNDILLQENYGIPFKHD
ncbi:hypothetical protein RFI_23727, partial [Reticulomyxa filosa]